VNQRQTEHRGAGDPQRCQSSISDQQRKKLQPPLARMQRRNNDEDHDEDKEP
jgi:hypothetical protein